MGVEVVAHAAREREPGIDVGHEQRVPPQHHDLVGEEHVGGERLRVRRAQQRQHRHGMRVADDLRAAALEAHGMEHRLHRRAPPAARLDRRERLRHRGVAGRGIVEQREQRRRLDFDEVRRRRRGQRGPARLDQHRARAAAQRGVALAQDRELRIPERPRERDELSGHAPLPARSGRRPRCAARRTAARRATRSPRSPSPGRAGSRRSSPRSARPARRARTPRP